MRKRLSALVLMAVFATLLAACGTKTQTQPDGSRVGIMSTGQLPEITIDGKAMRLAPGARIYNPGNLTITPNQVPANARVRYKVDATGLVNQVWVLPSER
jgi:hypothetical protein